MSILLVGLNHKTAPVQVREQLAFSRDAAATALVRLRQRHPDCEAVLLSTCNRVELLVAADDDKTPDVAQLVTFLAESRDLPVTVFRQHLYIHSGEHAVRHLMRVASGLDAMVVGDMQVVNQVRGAYALACEQGTTGRLLNRLFHRAFAASKRIHTETEIGERKVSVPSLAVAVAQQIFSDLSSKHVLMIGAGETAGVLCEYFHKAGVRRFTIASRTMERARDLASRFDGTAVAFSDATAHLIEADIVVTATHCPGLLIHTDQVRQAQKQRRGRSLYMIDLSVPRNIDPAVDRLSQVVLYDVDVLGRLAAENLQYREGQIALCEAILDQELDGFERWLNEVRVRPAIEQMYRDASELRDMELRRLLSACDDLTEKQVQAVRQMADRLANKLLHPCACTLRQHSGSNPPLTLAHVLREVTNKQRRLTRRRHEAPSQPRAMTR